MTHERASAGCWGVTLNSCKCVIFTIPVNSTHLCPEGSNIKGQTKVLIKTLFLSTMSFFYLFLFSLLIYLFFFFFIQKSKARSKLLHHPFNALEILRNVMLEMVQRDGPRVLTEVAILQATRHYDLMGGDWQLLHSSCVRLSLHMNHADWVKRKKRKGLKLNGCEDQEKGFMWQKRLWMNFAGRFLHSWLRGGARMSCCKSGHLLLH